MVRTFIAIEIPSRVQHEVFEIAEALRKTAAHVRWVREENIHLTIKFLGDIEEESIEELAKGVGAATQRASTFRASLSSFGVFPSLRSPRVVWVGVGEGEEGVQKLRKAIEESLARIGFSKETRKFTPHITIGRVKSRRGTEELASRIKQMSFSSEPFEVRGIAIFKSKLTPEGAIYTKLREVGLGCK